MKRKRYRGRTPWLIRQKVYRALCVIGLLVVIGSAGNSDAGAPLGPCVVWALVGLAMFAGFGKLGGLME